MLNSYNPRLVRSIIAVASIIMSVFLAITVFNAWTAYGIAVDDAERRAESTADLLLQQVQTTLDISRLVVDAMVTHGQNTLAEGDHAGITHDGHLMYMASHLPFSPWLVEIDASGRLRYMQNTQAPNSVPLGIQPAGHDNQNHSGASGGGVGSDGRPTSAEGSNPQSVNERHIPADVETSDTFQPTSASQALRGAAIAVDQPETATVVRPVENREAYKAYIALHSDKADSHSMIGPPISKTSGDGWYFGVSRKIIAPDGAFAGVAIVLLDANFLEVLARSVNLEPQSEMGLLGPDGSAIVWLAFDKGTVHLVPSSSTPFITNAKSGLSGTIQVYGSSDGKARIVSYRRIDAVYGLTAAVSVIEPAILGQWLLSRIKDFIFIVGFGLILALMAVPAFLLIVRPLRHVQVALNNVRDGNFEDSFVVSTGVREINYVMSGIERMRQSLKVLTDDLNARTLELTNSNAD